MSLSPFFLGFRFIEDNSNTALFLLGLLRIFLLQYLVDRTVREIYDGVSTGSRSYTSIEASVAGSKGRVIYREENAASRIVLKTNGRSFLL